MLGVCLVVLSVSTSFSQRINTYTKQTFTANWSSISGSGTRITTNCSNCDDYSYTFSLPFSFTYDNVTFNQNSTTSISTNGFMRLGVSTGQGCCGRNLGSSSYYNGLMIFSEDLYVRGDLWRHTIGNAPNRVLVLEWDDVRAYSGNGQYTSFQIRLYETSNAIEFIYNDHNWNTGSSTSNAPGVGLNGTTNGGFIYVTHQVSVYTPDSDIRWVAVPDRQIEVSPEYYDFTLADGGTVMTAEITVRSVGTAPDPILINNVVISTGHPDFTIISQPPSSLQPGESATFEVQWTAQGAGPRGAVLLVQSNGRDSGDQQVSLTGYTRSSVIEFSPTQIFHKKRVQLGGTVEEDILIKNIGEAPLVFTDPTPFEILGEDAPMYSIVKEPVDPLLPGMEDTLRIAFTPTIEGGHLADLFIHNNSSNTPDAYVKLKGIGVLPHITVTPDVMIFDSVELGTTVTKKFTICNPGTDTLILLRNEFTSADADFVLTPLVGEETKIAPEKCREVNVTFTPLQKGTRVARYHVMTNIPLTFEQPRRDTATTVLYFDIQGTGVPVGMLATDLDTAGILDSSIIGVELCRLVTITNEGDADATLTGATFGGVSASDYTVTGITFPHMLKAKSSVTVSVCGTPADRGSRLSELSIQATTNEKQVAIKIPVDIKGLKVCAEASPLVAFETSVIMNNLVDSVMITVTNCGDLPTTYTPSIAGTDAALYSVTPAISEMVAAGGSTSFWVYFTPDSRGQKSATLSIASEHVAPLAIALNGEGACAAPSALATVDAPKTKTGLTNPVTFPVTITNNGNLAWEVGTPTITGDAAFAFVAAGSDVTIPANGSGVINVSFHPQEVKVHQAQLTFPGSGPCTENEVTVNIAGESFEDLAVRDVRTADGYILSQNIPNPTQGATSFSYTLPRSGTVRIVVTDITGKTIKELVNASVPAGEHQVEVNTTGFASGTYLYVMEAGNARLVRQMHISK